MELVHKEGNIATLVCRRGEEIINALTTYVAQNNITSAHLTGLGAVDEIEIAYYDVATQEYETHHLDEALEILNLTGNISTDNTGKTIIHVHGTFARRDLSVIGGHVTSMRVSGVGEIHLQTFSSGMHRRYDDETGLQVLYPS
jgi:predicted DNA-binding protein with PD1-like motif